MANWITCARLLDCSVIQDNLTVKQLIGSGAMRDVHLAEWGASYDIALSVLTNEEYLQDFYDGVQMLTMLQSSPLVVKLYGICEHYIITEYHKYGSADNVNIVLEGLGLSNNVGIRFLLAYDYVMIIDYLHHSPIGTLVMCDSNDVLKTLSQYLITTDLHLILNDVDALPIVDRWNNHSIKCGKRQLTGDFVAPEQLWPYLDRPFEDVDMPGYDEKTDIWKIPKVTEHLLNTNYCKKCEDILDYLKELHIQCRSIDPRLRPTSTQILQRYSVILNTIL